MSTTYREYLIHIVIDQSDTYYCVVRPNGSTVNSVFDDIETSKEYIDRELWTKSEYFKDLNISNSKNRRIVSKLLEGVS